MPRVSSPPARGASKHGATRLHGEFFVCFFDFVRGGQAVHPQRAVIVLGDVNEIANAARLVLIRPARVPLPPRARLGLARRARLVRAALAARALRLFALFQRCRLRRVLRSLRQEARKSRGVTNLRTKRGMCRSVVRTRHARRARRGCAAPREGEQSARTVSLPPAAAWRSAASRRRRLTSSLRSAMLSGTSSLRRGAARACA